MVFSFENHERNQQLTAAGIVQPKFKKTGTTICGLIYKDGVVLGADTRATAGQLIVEKRTDKIHYIADNIYCCGAGTSADLDHVTKMISSQLKLHRFLIGKTHVPVVAASRMIRQHVFKYQGHLGVSLILGGYDSNGSYLSNISPGGSSARFDFTATGSGCLAALAVLEKEWKPNMELEAAKKLVRDAIAGGVFHDLGSGNQIDLLVINKDGTQHFKPYEVSQCKPQKEKKYHFEPKSTCVISRTVIPIKLNENIISRQHDVEPMEVL